MVEAHHVRVDPMTPNLLERLEAAKGPSRELDAWIDLVLYAEKVGASDESIARDLEYVTGRRDGIAGETVADAVNRTTSALGYTSSIDAALTLVPEGHDVRLIWLDKSCSAELEARECPPGWGGSVNPMFRGASAVLAIALCIACLRARAATQREGEE